MTHIILAAAEGLWHLGSLFYHDTQYSQLEWFTNIFWCDILLNRATHTGPHHIWCFYMLCPLSGQEKNTEGSGVGWIISLASVVIATLKSENIFLFESGVSNQNFTDGFLLEFDFFPGHCHRHLQQCALFTLLCMTRHSCSNPMLLRYKCLLQKQQNRSKAMMCFV
jgi:hypothetical protein